MLVTHLRNLGETTVLHCVGRIVAGEEVATLKRAVLLHATTKVIVLDLSHVDLLDGAGMGALVFLQGWTRVAGIRMQLANPRPYVRGLLELTNLDSVLEICPSPDTQKSVSEPALALRDKTATTIPCASH